MDNILYTCLEIHQQRKSERALKIPGKKKIVLTVNARISAQLQISAPLRISAPPKAQIL